MFNVDTNMTQKAECHLNPAMIQFRTHLIWKHMGLSRVAFLATTQNHQVWVGCTSSMYGPRCMWPWMSTNKLATNHRHGVCPVTLPVPIKNDHAWWISWHMGLSNKWPPSHWWFSYLYVLAMTAMNRWMVRHHHGYGQTPHWLEAGAPLSCLT